MNYISIEHRAKSRLKLIILCALCVFAVSSALADTDWQVLKTEHFEVFYKSGYEEKAKEALAVLEAYRDKVQQNCGKEIPKLYVVLEDIGTLANGFADSLNPNIHLFIYPPGALDGGAPGLGFGENWWRMVGVHESIHIGQLTNSSGLPGILTTAFGNIFSPNLVVPGWIIEGITVNGESRLSPYEGRLNDGYFDAVFGAYTKDKPFPTLMDMTYTPLDFPGLSGGVYLYGGLFLNYLRDTYGQEKLNEFLNNQGTLFFGWLAGWLFPATGIDYAAKQTYGKSFHKLWSEWQAHQSKQPLFTADGTQVSRDKLTGYSRLMSDGKYLYYVKTEFKKAGAYNTYRFERIIRRDINFHPRLGRDSAVASQEQELVSTTSFFNGKPQLVRDASGSQQLYYAVAEYRRGYANSTNLGFGIVSNLHCKDIKSGMDRIILRGEPFRTFVVMDDRIIYTKDLPARTDGRSGGPDGFGSEIWGFSLQTRQKQLLAKSKLLIDQLAVDGNTLIAAARPDWQNWGIYRLDPKTFGPTELVNTPYAEAAPSIHNGRIFFVANYDEVYRIYAYDSATKKIYKLGTNLFRKALIFDEFSSPRYPPAESFDLEALKAQTPAEKGGYLNTLKTLTPYFRFPILGANNYGAFLIGQDITYEHYYITSFVGGHDPYFKLYYETAFLRPLTLGLDYKTQHEEQDVTVFGQYPLWLQFEPGLSDISPSLEIRIDQDASGDIHSKELLPGLGIGLNYPRTRFRTQFNYIMERKNWDSPVDRDGAELTTSIAYCPTSLATRAGGGTDKASEFKAVSYLISDPDNTDLQELEIRGYRKEDALKTGRGGTLTLEYSFPLDKIRTGWWNPNIYWEDISMAVFSDTAFGEGNRPIYSVGAELRFEAALAFAFIKIVPTLGFAVPSEGDYEVYITIMPSSHARNRTAVPQRTQRK
ncbi:MAG: hypothetical protein HY762_03080 [Planctomycetes bacterium]|nr:hypothetical protein [Planctomycetota bacterium]